MVDEVDCFEEDFSSLDASMSGGTPPYHGASSNFEANSNVQYIPDFFLQM
jgi:hypothetical protein